jgi:hypothetical protein
MVSALALDGANLLVGGGFSNIGTQARAGVALVDTASGVATSWDAGLGTGGSVAAVAVTPSRFYIGGSFWSAGGGTRPNLAGFGGSTAGVGGPAAHPTALAFAPNRPNPFRDATLLHFTLPAQAAVELAIFDPQGRRVRTLVPGQVRAAGTYDVRFERGSLPSGVYLARLRVGAASASRRIVIE